MITINLWRRACHPIDGRVVSSVMMQVLEGEGRALQGGGCQTRAFFSVVDRVNDILRFMDAPDSFTGPVSQGNLQSVGVADIAPRLIGVTGPA